VTQFTHLLAHMNADKEAVCNFFAAFSRFEFALKKAGYASGGTQVSADWDRLAAVLRPHFDPKRTAELTEAVDYLVQCPPKKQVLHAGALNWVDSPQPQNDPVLLSLLVYVRRIRNNLFHGGKYSGSPTIDPDRDTTLLRHGLTVLDECLALCEKHILDVHGYFHVSAASAT
jgi:hypothetical protein